MHRPSHPLVPRRDRPRNHPLPMVWKWPDRQDEAATDDPSVRDPKLARLEAALMLADEPLTTRKLAAAADLQDGNEARRLLARLRERYDADGTAFTVHEIAGGYQLLSRPVFHHWLIRLRRSRNDLRISGAALETLAIVAYRQPITRADVEAVRGVQCGEVLTNLMERGLVRIVGRHDSLGRPVLYGTSKKFLTLFGLNTLDDLPEVEVLRVRKESP